MYWSGGGLIWSAVKYVIMCDNVLIVNIMVFIRLSCKD